LTIKYLGSTSTGQTFTEGETRSVNVTLEGLVPNNGYQGDNVTYTATVLDSTSAKLPATFVATLKFGATTVVSNQAFDASHYSQSSGQLTVSFLVPSGSGQSTVTLTWTDQII
jgi:hypothetical protein